MEVLCLNMKLMLDINYGKVFYSVFFLFGLVIPLVVIIVLYTFMILRLLKLGRNLKKKTSAKEKRQSKDGITINTIRKIGSENMRAKRKVMVMIVVVVVVFVVCWTPIHTVFLLQFWVLEDIDEGFICVRVFCNCLAYTNSCINPILYAFFSESFRESFKSLCSFLCFRKCLKDKNAFYEARSLRCEKTTMVEMKIIKKNRIQRNKSSKATTTLDEVTNVD